MFVRVITLKSLASQWFETFDPAFVPEGSVAPVHERQYHEVCREYGLQSYYTVESTVGESPTVVGRFPCQVVIISESMKSDPLP